MSQTAELTAKQKLEAAWNIVSGCWSFHVHHDPLQKELYTQMVLPFLESPVTEGRACRFLGLYAKGAGETKLTQYYFVRGATTEPRCLYELAVQFLDLIPLDDPKKHTPAGLELRWRGVGLLQLAEKAVQPNGDKTTIDLIEKAKEIYRIVHVPDMTEDASKWLVEEASKYGNAGHPESLIRMKALMERSRKSYIEGIVATIRDNIAECNKAALAAGVAG